MPKKYHISTKAATLDFDYIFKYKIVRGENCINCGKCTKVCIYEAHKRQKNDPRKMAEPNTVVCRNCFRCLQECPRGALEKSIDTDFSNTGGAFWKPDLLLSIWKQADDGKVPVSGAGYRGPFTGQGFDSMWTDMSEIVRPTRDGIHGREYINTAVDLGRKLNHLTFNPEGQIIHQTPDIISIPLPIIFDIGDYDLSPFVVNVLLKAAADIKTSVIMPIKNISEKFTEFQNNIIPFILPREIKVYLSVLKKARLIEIEYQKDLLNDLSGYISEVKAINQAVTLIRVPITKDTENIVLKLAQNGAEVIHLVADYRGQSFSHESKSGKQSLKDIIRSVHARLVDNCIRDEVTIVVSGGIAMAEYVPKAMLCGADLTAVDIPLLVALGLRLYEEPEKLLVWPERLENIPPDILTQRVVNLIGAWHSQILEMMGAMGIREARRLRGETGRAIFFEEIDRDTFGKLFRKGNS